jgi:uncharacterized UPF0160 family protein
MEERSFGTHDGSFHADEVTACSLLLVFGLIDRDKVVRTRDPRKLEACDFVCDVGGVYDPHARRFDHHQIDYEGPLSSAGMVLLYLKTEGVIPLHLYDYLNRSLILGVDAHDNGIVKSEVGTTTFSQVVSNFMPIEHDASVATLSEAFHRAVDFVSGHLERMVARYRYTLSCRAQVEKAMAPGSHCLLFEESIPWLENFFELGGEWHPAQYVIMPSGSHWKLRGIPPNLSDRMQVRRPLPAHWAGLRDEELAAASGVEGAIFCHKGRFISIWETKEAALKALHHALEKAHRLEEG